MSLAVICCLVQISWIQAVSAAEPPETQRPCRPIAGGIESFGLYPSVVVSDRTATVSVIGRGSGGLRPATPVKGTMTVVLDRRFAIDMPTNNFYLSPPFQFSLPNLAAGPHETDIRFTVVRENGYVSTTDATLCFSV